MMIKNPVFQYTCSTVPSEHLQEFLRISDRFTDITLDTFIKRVDRDSLMHVMHHVGYPTIASLKRDPYVCFNKSYRDDGSVVYSMDWSCIDHVFY